MRTSCALVVSLLACAPSAPPARSVGGTGGPPPGGSGGTGGATPAALDGGTGRDGPGAFDGPATAADAPSAPAGSPIPLPLVVTDHFQNVGWFGDGAVMAHFKPGSMIIQQADGTTGPC